MEINYEAICIELRRWANATKRETVAAEITQHYFELGGGDLPLYPIEAPGATHNNMQNIFRWLDSGSRKAKVKIEALKPAILKALEQRRYGTLQYLVARALTVQQADFIKWAEFTTERFDKVVMNPPFSEGRAKAHVESAASLVNRGGRLVAILPASFKGKDILPGWNIEWSEVICNEFANTSISVVILSSNKEV